MREVSVEEQSLDEPKDPRGWILKLLLILVPVAFFLSLLAFDWFVRKN